MPNADAAPASGPEDLVLTPGGMRDKSLVHLVEPGFAVAFDEETRMIQIVGLEDGTIHSEVPAIPRTVTPPAGESWSVYAEWENTTGTPLSRFSTTLQVPPPPAKADADATIFLYSGIQTGAAECNVLQPVLQWGESAAGGGSYWSLVSWYVTVDGNAFHTRPQPVEAGKPLVGLIEMVMQARDIFSYQCEFKDQAVTRLPVYNVVELRLCSESLEVHNIEECANLPGTAITLLQEIKIEALSTFPAVAWTASTATNKCKAHAVAEGGPTNGGEVEIHYGKQ